MGFFSFYMMSNPYYLIGTIFVIIAMFFSMYCQGRIRAAYSRYKQVPNHLGMTGAQLARQILDSHGMSFMPVNQVAGELSDHFDPTNMLINLSNDIYNGRSIAALAVAAHECGHAIQHHENYRPIMIRNTIVPVCNISNYLGWIAIMIGLIFGFPRIAWIGFILMLAILAFQIITLPVEFDASRRGLAILKSQYLTADEYAGASSVLSAAALTYVAATFATLASLLRIFLVIAGSNRRR
ncbi:MAG: zinc metallopeptidase [Erysipelotrichaceae bacterium]|nr:zinc metallopeptidase [Erysipelotrichaceae bacterium]